MFRFVLLIIICLSVTTASAVFCFRALSPAQVTQSAPIRSEMQTAAAETQDSSAASARAGSSEENTSDHAKAASVTGLPQRLSRALDDRIRQDRDAKLQLLKSAQTFSATFDSLASQINEANVRHQIWEQECASAQGAIAMGGNVSIPDPPPPPDVSFVQRAIVPASKQFESAFRQYNDDRQAVDYAFYKQFADIYGPTGEKKQEAIPKDPDIDPMIQEAIYLHDHAHEIIVDMSNYLGSKRKCDWEQSLRDVLTEEQRARGK